MPPAIVTSIEETRWAVAEARGRRLSIGLVPTMGALHEGHASSIRAARAGTGFVVVTIFVNPAQFGPKEDLSRYPRPFERDVAICSRDKADLIFHPTPETIYPEGFTTYVQVEGMQDVLCGERRPGHFRGVATVVLKLFNIVQPDIAYFGQKDAQQARLIQQMVHDLDVPVQIKIEPTVREADGLALSSRNQYLSAEERNHATVLHRSLEKVRRRIKAGERRAAPLMETIAALVAQTPGARLDYAAVVDADTLKPRDPLAGRILAALAVYVGTTRLIDNLIIDMED